MKRLLAILVTAVFVFTVLAGCGVATSSAPKEESKTASTAEAPKEETKPAEKGVEGKVEFFVMKQDVVNFYKDYAAKFNSANPGITVEVNNSADPMPVLQTRMASGDTPDIFTNWPQIPEFIAQCRAGYVMDITNQNFVNNAIPSMLDMERIDGKIYSVPIALNFMGVYYNKKIFKEVGVEVPKTYSELIDVAKKIKAAGKVPFVFPDKENWTVGQASVNMYGLFIKAYKQFFDDLAAGKTTCEQNADIKKVAERILELRTYGQKDTLGMDFNGAIEDFSTGKAAMFHQGNWAMFNIKKAAPDLDYGMFPFPGETADQTKIMVGIDLGIAVSSKPKAPEAALKFMSFITSKEVAQAFADLEGAPSCIKEAVPKVKEFADVINVINAGKTFKWPNMDWGAGMETENNKTVQMLVSNKDVAGYMKEMDRIFTENAKK